MAREVFIPVSIEEFRAIIKEAITEEMRNRPARETDQPDLIKINEVCTLLQVSKMTVYNWMDKGILQPYYLGSRLYFKRSEILETLNNRSYED